MICSRFKYILHTKSTLYNRVQFRRFLSSRFSKKCSADGFFGHRKIVKNMSSLRFILRDFSVTRLWSVWTRSNIVSAVVRRCTKDQTVRGVIQCFRQTLLRPRRTLILTATAACKARDDDESKPPSCEKNITDEELKDLVTELEAVEHLMRLTLHCISCGKRLVIDKKQPGITYCICKDPKASESALDGWVPYMEAEDVIIWRKEYKPGHGLYAYKVYGRYGDVKACDFAAVQVDGGYRRAWDAAVAALAVVERDANGVPDQAVLHWEVLWPKLFANRDYVYIRRHKEFQIKPNKQTQIVRTSRDFQHDERQNVHSNAKRKAMESERDRYRCAAESEGEGNKVYVIMSRSCEHPDVPDTKHAIRVSEYWSHMVVKNLKGPDEPGMEFVLTYYDEPAVGGMPMGVAAWASGRAAPAYLQRMRLAAAQYDHWRANTHQDIPDFTPFGPDNVSQERKEKSVVLLSEEDMESSKQGPELESQDTREQSTQTDVALTAHVMCKGQADRPVITRDLGSQTNNQKDATEECEKEKNQEEEETNGSWWRYLYPFYYFV